MSTATVQPTDQERVSQAAPSGRAAFAALYERHFAEIYDFAVRIVRNPDTAAYVVQSTFASAWTQVQRGDLPRQPRAWLYAIARNKAIDELRQKRRAVAVRDNDEGEPHAFAQIEPSKLANPEAAAQEQELVELVWGAAASLNPSEYSLLDMHLRRGLRPDELAVALGVKQGNIYTRLSRLRNSLEEAVTSALLMRRARPYCHQLNALLTDLGADELNREVRATIQQHLRACERCQESKRRFVSPAEIFAGLAVIGAAPGLQAAIWERTSSATAGAIPGSGAAGPTEIAGRVGHWLAHASTASKVVVAAVVASVTASITATLLILPGGADSPGGRASQVQELRRTTIESASDAGVANAFGALPSGVTGSVPNDPGLVSPEFQSAELLVTDVPATEPEGSGPGDDRGEEPLAVPPDNAGGVTPDAEPSGPEIPLPPPPGDVGEAQPGGAPDGSQGDIPDDSDPGNGQGTPGSGAGDCTGGDTGPPPADAAGEHPAPDHAPPQCSEPWPPGAPPTVTPPDGTQESGDRPTPPPAGDSAHGHDGPGRG